MYYLPFESVTGKSIKIVVLQLHVFEPFESVTGQSVRIADLMITCIIYHLNWSLESL